MENMDSSRTFHPPQVIQQRTRQTTICTFIAVVVLLVFGYRLFFYSEPSPEGASPVIKNAVAVLSGGSDVTGTIRFSQASALGHVTILGEIKGLNKSAKHGFHVHQLGDMTSGCASSLTHFNPFNAKHGAPGDTERHVGDLGNIQSDASGVATFSFTDKLISLNGALSVVGRTLVVHIGTDDLGRGGDEESTKTGNAGARAACGVIGLA